MVWGGEPGCEHVWVDGSWKNQNASGGWQGGAEGGRLNEGQRVAEYTDRKIPGDFCARCGAWRGQLGLEPTPELYCEHLVAIFQEVKRVLRDDGVLWLNLGDSYNNVSGGKTNIETMGVGIIRKRDTLRNTKLSGLKPKDLVGIPWRVAFALQGFAVVPFLKFS